jgi:hypothetical protein
LLERNGSLSRVFPVHKVPDGLIKLVAVPVDLQL